MTGTGSPEDPDRGDASQRDPDAGALSTPGGDSLDDESSTGGQADTPARDQPPAPGLTTFTIEGRTAPALFVVAWLGILLGGGITFVGIFATPGVPGGILFLVGLGLLSFGLVAAAGSQAIERRAAGWRAYSGPSPVLAFLAVLPLTVFLVVLVGTPLVWFGIDPAGPTAVLVSIVVTALAYLLVVRVVVVGTGSLSWRDLGVVRPDGEAVRDLLWGGLLAFPVLLVTGLVGLVLSGFLPIPGSPLPPTPDPVGLAMNLVTAAVVAPIGEELFFRGFATTAWARVLGRRRAIVRGAIFFAAVHVLTIGAGGAVEGLGLAAFALVVRIPVALALGWVFLRRRTLYAPIALHAVFNALQVLALGTAS